MNAQSLLFKDLKNILLISTRSFNQKLPEPIQYFNFKYYPRNENFQDPPCNPSKLFLIKRNKSMKGRTSKEKKILGMLNIDGDSWCNGHISIVKNIPEVNCYLWEVKHLITIKPIFWKGELPKDDFSGTYLRETGEFIISPKLKLNNETTKTTEEYLKDKHVLKPPYLKKFLLKKWEHGFTAHSTLCTETGHALLFRAFIGHNSHT